MINKPLFWILFNVVVFLAVYLHGRKWHGQLALWLSLSTCIAMIFLASIDPSWILASLVLALVYLGFLRMPDQRPGFKKIFNEYGIRSSDQELPAVLHLLGDKKWTRSAAFFKNKVGDTIPYFFWQGHTKHFVSSGEYVRTTTYSHYIAFIFPPGSVSEDFWKIVDSSADRSGNSWSQRIKFFFSPDTETPSLVTMAADGSFIVQYDTKQESAYYERRLAWMKARLWDHTRQH